MSKFEIATISNKNITVDLSELTNKENLYFNATEIAKQFNKRVQHYLDNSQTKELIEVIPKAGIPALGNLVKVNCQLLF